MHNFNHFFAVKSEKYNLPNDTIAHVTVSVMFHYTWRSAAVSILMD